MSAPLNPDYIKRESRGKASFYVYLGSILGMANSSQFLIPFGAKMSFEKSFVFLSTILLLLTFILMSLIREPSNKKTGESH